MKAPKKTNGHGKFPLEDCPFEPGARVEASGLYEICHADEARASVVFLKGEFFPACQRCEWEVRYKLLRAAPHISEDPDFREATEPEDNPHLAEAIPISEFPRQLGAAYGYRYRQNSIQTGGTGAALRNLPGDPHGAPPHA